MHCVCARSYLELGFNTSTTHISIYHPIMALEVSESIKQEVMRPHLITSHLAPQILFSIPIYPTQNTYPHSQNPER